MSPEQAKGKIVDKRSDLFALGSVYYQMLTGQRAFEDESMVETLSSVLRDDPAEVHEVEEELPRHLGRIVRHCLEKDPAKRFQSAADVRNELEALREEVVSGQLSEGFEAVEESASKCRWGPILVAAAAVALVLVGGLWFVSTRSASEPGSRSGEGEGRRSLAVLYFDNLSGDPELDWLRSGLPGMLVTELSQAEGLSVLGTDRMYRVCESSTETTPPPKRLPEGSRTRRGWTR